MKRFVRILFCLLLVLLMSTAALASGPEEGIGEADVSDIVLQAGGFFRAAEPMRGLVRGDPYAGAKQDIFEALTARAESVDISAYRLTVEQTESFYAEIVNDHPELIYVTGSFSYSYSGSLVIRVWPGYDAELGDAEVAQFNAACDAILAQIEPGWSELQKYLFLHDYLVTHCEYDLTYSNYNPYDALVTRSAVCQGYALAYQCLCDKAGLAAALVTSEGINHAWNLVTLGGERFYVDCTWDDPSNHWYEGYCQHGYFLRSRDAFGHTGNAGDVTDWVSGSTAVYGIEPGSTRYDGAWFLDLNTAVPMVGSVAAYAKDSDNANVYLRNLSTGAEQAVPLASAARWPVWDQQGYTWNGNFSSFAMLDGAFYFTTPTQVWRMDTAGAAESFYTLTDSEQTVGYLYGIVDDDGTLYYSVGTVGWENESFTRTELTIEPSVAPPAITGQPADLRIAQAGERVEFTVIASGEGLSYQWEYKDPGGTWTNWADKTKSVLSFNAIASRNGRQVRCVVTNESGTAISEYATLTIGPSVAAPAITGQPADVRIAQAGERVEFTVIASGEGLSYQWEYRDAGGAWTTWADKTKSVLSFNAIATRDGRQVRCVVTNEGGTVTSDAAMLHIEGALAITVQPTDAHTAVNQTVAFEVAAIGTDLTYQWQYKDGGGAWTDWADKTKSVMTCVAIASRSGRQVRCVVTDGSGNTVTSKAASVLIEGPLAIIVQPTDASLAVNQTAGFEVIATGTDLTYQWQYKDPGGVWTDWADKTKSAMTCVAIASRNGRQVRCVVTDGSGDTVTSKAASVLIEGALMLIVQPTDVSTAANQTVAFEVVASGTNLTYQWQYKDPGGVWTNWADKTKSAMTCVAIASRNGRQVRCVITDGAGNTVTSAAAALTIG